MYYLFITLYLFILPVIFIGFFWKILKKFDEIKEKEESKKENRLIRKHTTIEKSNFNNAFGGRKAYEIYKNTNGLYEPVTPSKGIKIKKKEE